MVRVIGTELFDEEKEILVEKIRYQLIVMGYDLDERHRVFIDAWTRVLVSNLRRFDTEKALSAE